MPTITAVEQDTWPPRVLVSVTGLTLGDGVELYRQVGGRRTLVRAGESGAVTDTSFLRTDAELPFGVPVAYVAVVNGDAEYATAPTTYTLPGGKVAVTDAITGDAAETVVMAWPDKARTRQASTFDVGGRTVVVSGPMGQPSGDIELFTSTTAALDDLIGVLSTATEGVVQIRQPGGYDGVDSYLAVLGLTERRFSQDGSDPRRIVVAQTAEVESWAPALEARGTTLQDIADVYDAVGPDLNSNPYFETNATGWTALNGTVARSTTQAHEGAASLLLTPNGSSASVEARADNVAVTVGVTYEGTAWVRCAVARNIQAAIIWRNAANAIVSTTLGPATAVAAGTWTPLSVSGIAPTSATQATFVPVSMGGTPPAGHTVHIDEAIIRRQFVNLAELADDYATLLDVAQADFT